jgi:hypothetical protein
MAVKTLKTKRVFAFAFWSQLRNTAPKDFPTTEELKSTINDILPVLKSQAGEYPEIMRKANEVADTLGNISPEQQDEKQKLIDSINDELRGYSKEHGNDVVEIVLPVEAYAILKMQFEREGWGKKWVATVEEFGELLAAFEEGNK